MGWGFFGGLVWETSHPHDEAGDPPMHWDRESNFLGRNELIVKTCDQG